MKKFVTTISIAILSLSGIYAYDAYSETKSSVIFKSDGWIGNGDKAEYSIKIDNKVKYTGNKSILIESKLKKVKSEFATIIQSIDAEQFIEKRIRFSGYVKTEKAKSASLWMRVDGFNGNTLQFDNMDKREIKGSNDWKKYNVVLDVPTGSKSIVLGSFLAGSGKAWFDNFKVEVVDKEIPSTNIEVKIKDLEKNPNKTFKNLDFEF